ncbi:MAG: CRISPR-associated helicase/endonuclease Cas3 [Burkholderiales bacterium]|nr:CRISPR-associated helicase/endonuclease Cas3 [Burkholderiales bacterium]
MKEPAPYFDYWGKAKPSEEGDIGIGYHLLPYHCLDVAAVGATWWKQSTSLRRQLASQVQLDVESPILKAWVLFFIALHDLGKLDVRFQMKAPSVLNHLQTINDPDDLPYPSESRKFFHGEAGYDWFLKEGHFYLGLEKSSASEDLCDAWRPWLGAVAGHHGHIVRQASGMHPPDAEEWLVAQDRFARKAWIDALATLFLVPAGLSLHDQPPVLNREDMPYLAGFCAVCDWLGSNETWFTYTGDKCVDLKKYFDERCRHVGEQRLIEQCGLLHQVAPFGGIAALLNANESPRQLQTVVNTLPLQTGLTLVEAPTGSGKTETALAYAWRLLDAGLADSIVFALPTQATANAMWDRLNHFADILFGVNTNLVLAHGRAKWHDGHAQLKQAASQRSAQATEDIRVQCGEWIAESRKRVFLGQIGVCTVDQVLLSVLPLRHKFVRGFGVMKSVLIVDEVHAYDHYMYGLLHSVLSQQRRAGGSAVLLSATLPASQRNQLALAWGSARTLPADAPYPLLTHIAADGVITPVQIADPLQLPPERMVAIECIQQPNLWPNDDLLDRVVDAAEAGARVVIICNLVDNAQQLARQLSQKATTPVDLFHARYRFTDRQEKEKTVLAQYGRNADRSGGRILVATQVVEQSLDLDFDWLITQLCPVDLLFQRLGRLHRHQRDRRPSGFEQPTCTVLTARDADYGLHKVIYGNTRVLWRTQQLLEAHSSIQFPAAYRDWIERVYERDDWKNEPESISLEYEKFHVVQNSKRDQAKMLSNDTMNPLADSNNNVRALTRDGEMSLSVVLLDTDGKLLYDHYPLPKLDDWDRAEKMSLGSVSVPNSWQGKFSDAIKDDQGNFLLTMTRQDNQNWIGQAHGMTLRYSKIVGLEKIESDGV